MAPQESVLQLGEPRKCSGSNTWDISDSLTKQTPAVFGLDQQLKQLGSLSITKDTEEATTIESNSEF